MRRVFGILMVGGLVLGMASSASAQDTMAAGMGFSGYPAGVTTGSNYGYVPGGYAPVPYTQPGYAGSSGYTAGTYATTPNTGYAGTTTYPAGTYGQAPSTGYAGTTSYPAGTYGTTSYGSGYYGMGQGAVNSGTTGYSPYTSNYPLYSYPSARTYGPYYNAAPNYSWQRGGILRGMMGRRYR